MNPQLQQFSESDCEIAYSSDSFKVEIQNQENNSSEKLEIGYDQFEQQSILNNYLNSTQCSSSNKVVVKSEYCDSSDELKCSEIDSREIPQITPSVVIKCQCSKSQCQQSYCECFARGRICGIECGCLNCENKQISKKLKKIQKRLKKQQREKQRTPRFLKGCTCGRSKCINKFCSCHSEGKYCSEECKCLDCKNVYKFSLRKLENFGEIEEDEQSQQQYCILFKLGNENSDHFKLLNEYLQNICA